MKIADYIKKLLRGMRLCVMVDPTDNTLTLSGRLLKELHRRCGDKNPKRMYMFKRGGEYGFIVDPQQWGDVEDEAFSPLQTDDKTGLVGFALTEPTGIKICYDYGLSVLRPVMIRVRCLKLKDEHLFMLRRKRRRLW